MAIRAFRLLPIFIVIAFTGTPALAQEPTERVNESPGPRMCGALSPMNRLGQLRIAGVFSAGLGGVLQNEKDAVALRPTLGGRLVFQRPLFRILFVGVGAAYDTFQLSGGGERVAIITGLIEAGFMVPTPHDWLQPVVALQFGAGAAQAGLLQGTRSFVTSIGIEGGAQFWTNETFGFSASMGYRSHTVYLNDGFGSRSKHSAGQFRMQVGLLLRLGSQY